MNTEGYNNKMEKTLEEDPYKVVKQNSLNRIVKEVTTVTPNHIKKSTDFVDKIKDMIWEKRYLLVSVDVISLFTKVLVKDT